jgi:signal transduction histidine kinase
MKYLIKNNKGDTILSNLNASELELAHSCSSQSEQISINKQKFRHGKLALEDCSIYLLTNDEKITGKIFKKYQEIFSLFSNIFNSSHSQIRQSELNMTRRLKHNLVTYNSHILQEIYQLIPQDEITSIDGKSQLKKIDQALSKNTSKTSQAFLRILKNASLEKAEFDVFDKLYKNDSTPAFIEHSIHKIILLTINTFWLDFLELGIDVEIQSTNKKVILDYNSFSVALGHIFDNSVKYALPNSKISIWFYENVMDDHFDINIDMISLKVCDSDKEKIFQEGVSGECAKEKEVNGSGVGLYIARRMIELNNGTIKFFPNISLKESRKFENYPYEKNRIRIALPDHILK